ncbi:hypothetical protein AAFF39_03840 [Lactococcus garvieae]
MAFTTDFSQVQEHAEFKEQPYEMVVFDAKEEPNKNGKNVSSLILLSEMM